MSDSSDSNASVRSDDKTNQAPRPLSVSSTNASVSASKAKQTIEKSEKWSKLNNLKALYDEGFITQIEYRERKSQIIDALTGTTGTATKTHNNRPKPSLPLIEVLSKPPPDFTTLASETAVKHIFDPFTQSWSTETIKVKLDTTPFAAGGLRQCFYLQDLSAKSNPQTIVSNADNNYISEAVSDEIYVAKISRDPFEDREIYFADVAMQMHSKLFAHKFNLYNPPKRIDFVKAWLLELTDRQDRPLCGVERYIHGPYRKHNNNFGYVSEDERSTPQAFSHFTYEASNHKILICDIQGVGDLYTDPQMHTVGMADVDTRWLGKGDMGARGIAKFLATHQCNAVCRYLKLPSINAKEVDVGTVPSSTYMKYQHVDVVNIEYYRPIDPSDRSPLIPHISQSQPARPASPTARGCCCICM